MWISVAASVRSLRAWACRCWRVKKSVLRAWEPFSTAVKQSKGGLGYKSEEAASAEFSSGQY